MPSWSPVQPCRQMGISASCKQRGLLCGPRESPVLDGGCYFRLRLATWVLLPEMIWELALQPCLLLRPDPPQAAPACPIPNLLVTPGNQALWWWWGGVVPSRWAMWNCSQLTHQPALARLTRQPMLARPGILQWLQHSFCPQGAHGLVGDTDR